MYPLVHLIEYRQYTRKTSIFIVREQFNKYLKLTI